MYIIGKKYYEEALAQITYKQAKEWVDANEDLAWHLSKSIISMTDIFVKNKELFKAITLKHFK